MDERDVQEERTEHLIQVRRVTDVHAAWTEGERGASEAGEWVRMLSPEPPALHCR